MKQFYKVVFSKGKEKRVFWFYSTKKDLKNKVSEIKNSL